MGSLLDSTQKEINEKIKLYLELKCNNNYEFFYCDPIVFETLYDDNLYDNDIKPIIKIDKEEYFCKIISLIKNFPKLDENKQKLIDNLITNVSINYQNFYYNELILRYFEMRIINYKTLDDFDKFIKYFIEKESFDNKLNIEFVITKVTDILKELFNSEKLIFSKKELESFIERKKKSLTKLRKYRLAFGFQTYKEKLEDSVIELNISNFYKLSRDKNLAFQVLIDVIFHECRHAFQISGKDLKLQNEYERTSLFLELDYDYYLKNHDCFFSEIDADIYSLEKRKELFNMYFYSVNYNEEKYKKQKAKILMQYYSNKNMIDRKIDLLLIENPSQVEKYKTLSLEYENTGYPKDIFQILNEKLENNNIIYDEIIIRCLNRLDNSSYIKLIENLIKNKIEYLNIIDESLINKVKKINEEIIFLEENFKNKYENSVIPYTSKIYYYYLELLKIKKQNRVDKIYSK